jgi:hypothetical protein
VQLGKVQKVQDLSPATSRNLPSLPSGETDVATILRQCTMARAKPRGWGRTGVFQGT